MGVDVVVFAGLGVGADSPTHVWRNRGGRWNHVHCRRRCSWRGAAAAIKEVAFDPPAKHNADDDKDDGPDLDLAARVTTALACTAVDIVCSCTAASHARDAVQAGVGRLVTRRVVRVESRAADDGAGTRTAVVSGDGMNEIESSEDGDKEGRRPAQHRGQIERFGDPKKKPAS